MSVRTKILPVSLSAACLLAVGCGGLKALPQEGQYDPSPSLRGGLTGNESVMDAPPDSLEAPAAPSSRGSGTAATLPASYRDIVVRPQSYLPPLLSSRADTLSNGAVVYWVQDSTLPLADIRFLWKEGALSLPPQEALEAQMLGSMLRQGGTALRPARWIDDTLEILGADISIGIGGVRSQAQVQGFSRDIPFLLDLLEEMLRSPALDTSRLSLAKTEAIQGIQHRLDAPAQVLDAAWTRVQYGPSPWSRRADSLQVERVTPASLRKQLAGRFAARGCVVAVSGKVDRAQVRRKLESLLKGSPDASLTKVPALPQAPDAGVWIAPVEATQAFLKIGTRFVRRDHPDYYPLMLACQVLGSGFGTRLVDRIRSDEGLAYHVSAFAGSDYDRVSTLGVELQTKSASAHRAVALVFEEIRKLRDQGFRPGELDRARKGLKASLPTLFDTPEATAEMFAQSASWGRQDDHFRTYQKAMDTIPEAVVLETFRRRFVPDSLHIVVAGPKDALLATPADGSPALSAYGKVRILEAGDFFKDAP